MSDSGALAATKSALAVKAQVAQGEETVVHTRILRLALGIEESRAYWTHVDPTLPAAPRAIQAFEQRWFGAKSLHRVRTLLANFAARYDACPDALSVLRRWRSMDLPTRQVLCHFHLQLTDPLYRQFTGTFLVERRSGPEPRLDRDIVLRWVQREYPGRWGAATCIQFASKLLSAASEAGLVSPHRDPRTLLVPKVTDAALTYLMYLLRSLRFSGTLTVNPYLASVGLSEGFVDQRLRVLPGLRFRRMGDLTEFDWDFPSLLAFGESLS